ncbi:MAG: c-type cytochrome [Gemmatimonadota bacterium]|jgi:putative heme-binding domain-containing protein
MMMRTLVWALALLLVAWPAEAGAQQANPFDGDPMAVRAGRALFANRCAECHGADAKGYSGPDLTVLWADGATDARVFRTIRDGVSGSIMPSSSAPDQEIWALVSWVKSISTVAEVEVDVGDAERGREVFEARCTRCHRVAGEGGSLGPELSRIGRVRTREALIRAIREPGASAARGFRPVTLVTSEGERVRGTLKSEDAFSIQIMDTRQELRGYRKADLSEIVREPGSLMPTFTESRLPQAQLDDLVRYLGTLR